MEVIVCVRVVCVCACVCVYVCVYECLWGGVIVCVCVGGPGSVSQEVVPTADLILREITGSVGLCLVVVFVCACSAQQSRML